MIKPIPIVPHCPNPTTKINKKKKGCVEMEYIRKSRTATHGKANIELYDKDTGKIINRVSTVDNNSCLKFLSEKKTSGYSDISGTTCEMVMFITRMDDNGNEITEVGTSTVEILELKGNYVNVLIDGDAYTVYKGVAKFYKI